MLKTCILGVIWNGRLRGRMKKVLIWGTGSIAKRILNNSLGGELIGFIETEKEKREFMNLPVYNVSEIPDLADVIIVANSFSDEIYQICVKKRMDLKKMVFMVRGSLTAANDTIKDLEKILGERNYVDYQVQYGIKKIRLLMKI